MFHLPKHREGNEYPQKMSWVWSEELFLKDKSFKINQCELLINKTPGSVDVECVGRYLRPNRFYE